MSELQTLMREERFLRDVIAEEYRYTTEYFIFFKAKELTVNSEILSFTHLGNCFKELTSVNSRLENLVEFISRLEEAKKSGYQFIAYHWFVNNTLEKFSSSSQSKILEIKMRINLVLNTLNKDSSQSQLQTIDEVAQDLLNRYGRGYIVHEDRLLQKPESIVCVESSLRSRIINDDGSWTASYIFFQSQFFNAESKVLSFEHLEDRFARLSVEQIRLENLEEIMSKFSEARDAGYLFAVHDALFDDVLEEHYHLSENDNLLHDEGRVDLTLWYFNSDWWRAKLKSLEDVVIDLLNRYDRDYL